MTPSQESPAFSLCAVGNINSGLHDTVNEMQSALWAGGTCLSVRIANWFTALKVFDGGFLISRAFQSTSSIVHEFRSVLGAVR